MSTETLINSYVVESARKVWNASDKTSLILEKKIRHILSNIGLESSKTWTARVLFNKLSNATWRDKVDEFNASYPFRKAGQDSDEYKNSPLSQSPSEISKKIAKLLDIEILDDQQKAELLLALIGEKTSRLMLSLQHLLQVCESLGLSACYIAEEIIFDNDKSLYGYSNVVSERVPFIDPSPDKVVFSYFGRTYGDAEITAVLDYFEKAAALYGIPQCCVEYFNKNWEESLLNHSGDMAFRLFHNAFARSDNEIIIPWQTNPYGMYRGMGFLWHFPCSINCMTTIELVSRRYEEVGKIARDFAETQRLAQSKPFYLYPNRTFSLSALAEDGVYINPKID